MDMKSYDFYRDQIQQYVFDSFGRREAFKLGNYISEKAIRENTPLAVHIEINKETVYEFYNEGSTPVDREWIEKKIKCVHYFHKSSAAIFVQCEEKGRDPKKYYADKNIAAIPGACPIFVKDVGMIGSIGISAYKDSFADHELIIEGFDFLIKDKREKKGKDDGTDRI